MPDRVRIRWKTGALWRVRRAPGVQSELEHYADRIAATANRMSRTTGFKTSSLQGARKPQGRWRTTVITADYAAIRDNAKNATLLKALVSNVGVSLGDG